MSDRKTEEQAREAARRAQEAEIRRRQIQEKIDELEREKSECSQLIASLNAAKGEVSGACAELIGSTQYYAPLPTTAFNGNSAIATAQGMGNAIASIQKSATSLQNVCNAIGVQITRIQTYIGVLDREIDALRSGL